MTRGNTRGEMRSRESLPKREKTSDSFKLEWPDPMKVITRDKEIKMKKDKIQVFSITDNY